MVLDLTYASGGLFTSAICRRLLIQLPWRDGPERYGAWQVVDRVLHTLKLDVVLHISSTIRLNVTNTSMIIPGTRCYKSTIV